MTQTLVEQNPSNENKNKWIKMGNAAVQPNANLFQVSFTYTDDATTLFNSSVSHKAEIKRKMARDLAEKIVNMMTFTVIKDEHTSENTVFGRAYIFPYDAMKTVMGTTATTVTSGGGA